MGVEAGHFEMVVSLKQSVKRPSLFIIVCSGHHLVRTAQKVRKGDDVKIFRSPF